MASTSGSVMLRAAAHLNDANQLVYTSDILLPMFNMAIDELQEELAVYEIGEIKKTSVIILVPKGSKTLPQLPVDFMESISLIERQGGTQNAWTSVKEVVAIDPALSIAEIMQWAERFKTIEINAPTVAREVLLEYVASMSVAADEDSLLDIESSRRFLALVTARNAARDLGNSASKAATYEADIGRARDRLTRRLQKKSQNVTGVRRRPYRGRR
jgi:hypothetical protein